MPLIISEHTMGDWTDEEVLRHCVCEYADFSNYEPYEKDYGVGRPVMLTPYFARNPRDYAEQTLKFLEERQKPVKAPTEHYLPAVRVPDSPALHMQMFGRAYRLTPHQKAYLKAYKLMCRLKAAPEFYDLPIDVQDEINNTAKECGKWL